MRSSKLEGYNVPTTGRWGHDWLRLLYSNDTNIGHDDDLARASVSITTSIGDHDNSGLL